MGKSPLRSQALALVGKNWSVGKLTRQKNIGNIARLCDRIHAKYGLENLQNLKEKHISGVFADMSTEGLKPTTIAGYLTAARTIAQSIGKQNIVPHENSAFGGSRAGHRLNPKEVNREGLQSVRDAVAKKAEWMGLAADMAREFGLRMAGSISRYSLVNVDGKEFLRVKEKGGLTRHVPFDRQSQVETVQRVFSYIHDHNQTSLVPSNMTLKQGYNALRDAWRDAGGTKCNGSNFHAHRHAYVQERTGNNLNNLKKEEREELTRAVGHFDTDKLRHYSR